MQQAPVTFGRLKPHKSARPDVVPRAVKQKGFKLRAPSVKQASQTKKGGQTRRGRPPGRGTSKRQTRQSARCRPVAEGPEESGLGMLVAAAEQELPSLEVGVQKCSAQICCRSLFCVAVVCHRSDAHIFYLHLWCCNATFLRCTWCNHSALWKESQQQLSTGILMQSSLSTLSLQYV